MSPSLESKKLNLIATLGSREGIKQILNEYNGKSFKSLAEEMCANRAEARKIKPLSLRVILSAIAAGDFLRRNHWAKPLLFMEVGLTEEQIKRAAKEYENDQARDEAA